MHGPPTGSRRVFISSSTPDAKTLFDSAPAPLMVLDRELKYVAANAAYLQATALRREEVLGRSVFDVLAAGDGAVQADGLHQLRASFERVIAQRMPDLLAMLALSTPRRTPEGRVFEERQWSYSHKPLLDDQGNVAFIVQHAVDVTDLRPPEEMKQPLAVGTPSQQLTEVLTRAWALQENNKTLTEDRAHLRQLFEMVPGVVAVLRGPEFVFEIANDNYLSLIGKQNIIGLTVAQARPELKTQGIYEMLGRVFHQGETVSQRGLKVRIQKKQGASLQEIFVDFDYMPVRLPNGKITGIFAYGQDVTEKKLAEEQVRHYREHLEDLVRERTRALEESEAERRQTEEQPAPVPEDGGGGQAHRRRGARLQQPAAGHRRQPPAACSATSRATSAPSAGCAPP